jgi:tagatose 1,6-diphosphate aldolase
MANAQVFSQNGKYFMLALDQRGSFRKLINPQSPDQVRAEQMVELKAKILGFLPKQATGGWPALKKAMEQNPDLANKPFLMCVEKSGYQDNNQERVNQIQYPVADLKNMGAAGVKLLIYFNPWAKTVQQQLQTAKIVLADCQKNNLPLFLEIVTYNLKDEQKSKAELILKSLKMFLQAQIKPAVFKLEYPEKESVCLKITQMLQPIPWVILSAGVTFNLFYPKVKAAMKNGAAGFLVGRALWQEATQLKDQDQQIFLKKVLPKRFGQLAQT